MHVKCRLVNYMLIKAGLARREIRVDVRAARINMAARGRRRRKCRALYMVMSVSVARRPAGDKLQQHRNDHGESEWLTYEASCIVVPVPYSF